MSRMPWKRLLFNTLGYGIARKDRGEAECPALPVPSDEELRRAEGYFANCFPIAPGCRLAPEEIRERARDFFWHYPFRFGDVLIEADLPHFRGLDGRHHQRYMHFFPPLLRFLGGSFGGRSVIEIGCNAGFWSVQARLAGASRVLGVDLGEKNIDQARFILEVTGLDAIEYRVLNAYDVSPETVGRFDVTFFLGLLYHIDRPVEALERLHAVTGEVAVIDTTLARSDVPDGAAVLKLEEDSVHDQNVSNRIALVPSKNAVPRLLKHVGFKEVYWVRNASRNLPLDYLTHARMTFIAVK